MHNTNTEWFWNSSANNHFALPVSNNLSMQRAASLSTNAILTDVNICVGMRNVNLNGKTACFIENLPHCCEYSIPRQLIPSNWYNNYAQYLCRDELLTKYHQSPVHVSNEWNYLLANECSSTHIRDGIFKFRQNMSVRNFIYPEEGLSSTGVKDIIQTAYNSASIIRDEFLDPSLAPPKKKWIRHYMMGE